MDKKLEVKDLQISFRTQGGILKAVRKISFDLHKGETLAIVGESGSGKSVTSKAIMGILSGNSIVEGGEILYDGQDLLKIDEEDFHKIRGDKIAMIFQDPMSSLNPIMRVGAQLTEAMILKAKTGKKNARTAFNTLLKRLQENINLAQNDPALVPGVAEKITAFDNFCILNTKIEEVYNEAYTQLMQVDVNIDNVMLLLQKQRRFDLLDETKEILKLLKSSIHEYVIVDNSEIQGIINDFATQIALKKEMDKNVVVNLLTKVQPIVKEALNKEKPNFFTLAYYKYANPTGDLSKYSIKEMNDITRKYLDDNFMMDFIALAEKGVNHSHNISLNKKKAIIPDLENAIAYFNSGELNQKIAKNIVKDLSIKVKSAIDYLKVKKNSLEYVFESALNSAVRKYFNGVKANPIEEKAYLKNKAKYEKLVASGKSPDWVLKPQVIVDLDLVLSNINKILVNLKDSYNNDLSNNNYNANQEVIDIIDFLKEQASRLVVKMNKSIAKAKAIKLMEEVGIPEPAMRFKQYPFEFSGGMRQRIVIAIALSANPDILICDEPTTALDVTIQAQILELINDIKKQRNLSVIFITHNLGVVANMADRIAVMYAGKIVEHGTSEEIFYEPAHPYTWALLSSMPDLHTTERLESIPGTPPNMIYPPKGDAFAARNKYALDIDFEMEPPLFEVSPTHYAATWLLHPNAPKVEMPRIIQNRVERMKKERELNG